MKILALNLNKLGPAAGNGRPANLVRYFRDSKADVLVFSEFKKSLLSRPFKEGLAAAGCHGETCFAAALEMEGFRYKSVSKTDGNSGLGVAVFSRRQAKPVSLTPHSDDKNRITALEINGFSVIGVYFFAGDRNISGTGKFTLFDYLLSVPEELSGRSLVMGDFNTGLHCLDEEGKTFSAESRFKAMEERGWVDLWRAKHGKRREFSFKTNRGNEYRIDHAFGCGGVKTKVAGCYYDHSTRCADEDGKRLSDHSAIIVSLDL